jgi:uncharacterized coiled-coil protein SlyX
VSIIEKVSEIERRLASLEAELGIENSAKTSMSDIVRESWKDPDTRRKRLDGIRQFHRKNKKANGAAKGWTPERRARQAERMRQVMSQMWGKK